MNETYLMVNGQRVELTDEQKKQLGIVEEIKYACKADIVDMMNCDKKHCDKCVHGEYHPIEVIKDV